MASKLLWGGLTLVVCAPLVSFIPAVATVGMIIMIIGAVLNLLDK